MQVENIDIGQNDDHTWYINLYGADETGTVRRETLADNLTEDEASELLSPLQKHTHKLIM